MKTGLQPRRRSQEGIALLIAIFVLLLISVVAIALLVSSGTETALGANYRSSSTVYYAALAGLEEARGRLLPKNPGYLGAGNIPPATPLPIGQTIYITNPATGETVDPCDPSNAYYDKEYYKEFGHLSESTSCTAPTSVWVGSSYPGPTYKWVRINSATEQSIYTEVDSNGFNGPKDGTTPLLYDPGNVNFSGNPWPSLIEPLTTAASPLAVPAYEITALAQLPNRSKKMLQYLVAPIQPNLSFSAALTLDGNGVQFTGPGSNNGPNFIINGSDQYAPPGSCHPGATAYPAIGYTNPSDGTNIANAESPATNYQGTPSPSRGLVSPTGYLSSLAQLNNLVQMLTMNADHTVTPGTGTAYGSDLTPFNMSASAPQTIVVNGNLDLNGWHNTGYGILLVTGELKYDPDAYWDGIVLVIGKGKFTLENNGFGQIDGALFIAQTVDSTGAPLSSLGPATFGYQNGSGGRGIDYSSCWINYVQSPLTYKILSFHELPQPQ